MKITYVCPECGYQFEQGDYNYNYDYANLEFECPICEWFGTDDDVEEYNEMEIQRENLRRHFSALLMNTDNENHLKCNITIEDSAMGLSTLQMPKVIGAFQDPKEGIICFYIEGDCIVDFDDMEYNDLINIFNTLKEQYRIETKVID